MKYKSWNFKESYNFENKEGDKILPSIPNVHLPKIVIKDNLVDSEMHKQLWDYLNKQVWHHWWTPLPGEMQVYRPSDYDDSWINAAVIQRKLGMPRCMFGSDEHSIKKKHPIIWDLWQIINQSLDNQYEITGVPEEMSWEEYPVPKPEDPSLETGWRVYANASAHDLIQGGGSPHRDTINVLDDTTATILWVANQEWYPSWGGELMFYPEDPKGLTGDHQQFGNSQKRDFNIGWPDAGKLCCLVPNRLIAFDGRTLHATIPTRHRVNVEPIRRVVFRARKKKQ